MNVSSLATQLKLVERSIRHIQNPVNHCPLLGDGICGKCNTEAGSNSTPYPYPEAEEDSYPDPEAEEPCSQILRLRRPCSQTLRLRGPCTQTLRLRRPQGSGLEVEVKLLTIGCFH